MYTLQSHRTNRLQGVACDSTFNNQPSAISHQSATILQHFRALQFAPTNIQLSFNLTKCNSNNFLVNHVTLNFCSAAQLSMSWYTHTCSLSHLMCILNKNKLNKRNLIAKAPPSFLFHFSFFTNGH